jgi:hypothetical protein
MLLPPLPRGRPRKTERPHRLPQRDHPINHHVTDRLHGRIADRDKPGRPRAPPPRPRPRPRAPRADAVFQRQQHLALDAAPDTDKQQRQSRPRSFATALLALPTRLRVEVARHLWLAGRSAGFIWDYEGWDSLTMRHIRAVREAGALARVPLALSTRVGVHLFGRAPGDWRARPQTNRGHTRRADSAGGARRATSGERAHEPRDRYTAVHQPEDGRIPPSQGVPQARREVTHAASHRRAAASRASSSGCSHRMELVSWTR